MRNQVFWFCALGVAIILGLRMLLTTPAPKTMALVPSSSGAICLVYGIGFALLMLTIWGVRTMLSLRDERRFRQLFVTPADVDARLSTLAINANKAVGAEGKEAMYAFGDAAEVARRVGYEAAPYALRYLPSRRGDATEI